MHNKYIKSIVYDISFSSWSRTVLGRCVGDKFKAPRRREQSEHGCSVDNSSTALARALDVLLEHDLKRLFLAPPNTA